MNDAKKLFVGCVYNFLKRIIKIWIANEKDFCFDFTQMIYKNLKVTNTCAENYQGMK